MKKIVLSMGVHILNFGVGLALLANAASATSLDSIEYDLLADSCLNQENGLETQIRLQGAGYFTYLTKAKVDGKEFTRVVVDVNGSEEEVKNVGNELLQKGLIKEYIPIEDKKDANLPEILGKRRYLPQKTPEISPKIEDVLLLYTENFQNGNPLTCLERAKLFRDLIDSHWETNIHMKLVRDYKRGEIDNFDVVIYIGENYHTRIPRALINDVNDTIKEILWINYHPWKLNTRKLGFKVYDKHSAYFDKISYRNYDFKLNPTDTSLVKIINPEKSKVLAWLVDSETGKRIPAVVNANDHFLYVSYLPLAVPYLDEPIPFFNALHETFGHHKRQSTVLFRLEDINAGPLDFNLTSIGEFLKQKSIAAYHFGVIPVYVNPQENINISILDNPELINTLKSMQLDNGGLVLHGYTHQYDGETAIDFEFWDESKNKPVAEDSQEFAQKRVIAALDILKKAKLSTDMWETPHYKASEVDYQVFKKIFPILYDSGSGINVPFIFKSDNTVFSPIDLGYVSSSEPGEKIINSAKKIYDCFEDPSVSFFYHPYLFSDQELGKKSLGKIIDSLRDTGYEFHSIYDLLEKEKSFEEKVILGKKSFQKGIEILPAYSKDRYFSYEINKDLDHLEDIGVEWVEVQTLVYQNDIRSSSIFVDKEKTASDESLEYIINKLHKRGFKVFFEPVVNLKHRRRGEWMGIIRPNDWDAWFESYSKFIEHYAKLAQKTEVEQFVVGVELTSTHKYKEKWEQIIDNVRKHYQGMVVFVSNFDSYETVPFWDKLDVIAMNFYFPINRRDNWYQPWTEVKSEYHDPSYEDLVNGWQLWVDTLDKWQKKMNKPILVTEVGYASQRGCSYQPWSWYLGESDFEEQYSAYKAFYEVWSKKQIVNGKFHEGNYLQGVYFFHWADKKPENDRSYIPSKDAKSIIKKWFTGTESNKDADNG